MLLLIEHRERGSWSVIFRGIFNLSLLSNWGFGPWCTQGHWSCPTNDHQTMKAPMGRHWQLTDWASIGLYFLVSKPCSFFNYFFFPKDRKIIVVRVGGDDDRERVMYPLGLVQHQVMMMWAHVGFWCGDGKEALFSFQLFSMEGKFLAFWQLMCVVEQVCG